jgi:hypothetical protein
VVQIALAMIVQSVLQWVLPKRHAVLIVETIAQHQSSAA